MGVDSIAPARLELKILLPPFECWDCRDELLCLTFFASTSLCLILTSHTGFVLVFLFSLVPHHSFFFFLGDLCLILTLVVYVDTDLGITVSFSIVLTRTKEKPK